MLNERCFLLISQQLFITYISAIGQWQALSDRFTLVQSGMRSLFVLTRNNGTASKQQIILSHSSNVLQSWSTLSPRLD